MKIIGQQAERVESGPIQFGNDWPGLFMRGDDAFGHAFDICTVWGWIKDKYGADPMPSGLVMAMMKLAGVADEIFQGVDVGKVVKESLSSEIDATIKQQTSGGT